MKQLNSFSILFTFILLLLTPSLATAALTPEATEIPYQINNSDRIVIGTVSEINVYSGYTITTIKVKEWLYNPLPAKIIKVMITNGAEDEAEFTQNESVLVMLNDKRPDLQLFSVAIGSPGKHLVSDRNAVIKELKAQGKWQNKNLIGNITNNTGTVDTGTVSNQEEKSNSTQESKNTPFISLIWVLATVLGVVLYMNKGN